MSSTATKQPAPLKSKDDTERPSKVTLAPPATGTVPAMSWADMAQDMDEEGTDELVTFDTRGNRVFTTYFRESDGKQMKRERTVKVTRKVQRVPVDVKNRQTSWKPFGWDSLDLKDPMYQKFQAQPVPSTEVMDLPRNQNNDFGDLVPSIDSTIFRRQMTDIQKYFDLLTEQEASKLLAMAEKESAAGAAAAAAAAEYGEGGEAVGRDGGRGDSDDRTVRVTNVPEWTTERELETLFGRVGDVQRCYLSRNKETQVSKGFAFVTFTRREDADKAIRSLNKKGFQSVLLNVEWAKRRAPPAAGQQAPTGDRPMGERPTPALGGR